MAQEEPTIREHTRRPVGVASVRGEERRVAEDVPASARLAGRGLA